MCNTLVLAGNDRVEFMLRIFLLGMIELTSCYEPFLIVGERTCSRCLPTVAFVVQFTSHQRIEREQMHPPVMK